MSRVFISIIVILLIFLSTLIYYINRGIGYTGVNKLFNDIYFDRYLISEDYHIFKDGDIIYNVDTSNVLTKNLIPSPFNHVGMIIKKDNKLFVIDASKIGLYRDNDGISLQEYNNVHMECLLDKIKYNLRISFICRLNKELDNERKELLHQLCDNYLGKKYTPFVRLTLQYFLSYLSICINQQRDVINCCELVSDLLSGLNLIDTQPCLNNSVKMITTIYNYQLNDSYHYEIPKQIIYDIR